MHTGNLVTAMVAVLVFLITVGALWAERSWWFLVPLIGYVILVPFIFVLLGEW